MLRSGVIPLALCLILAMPLAGCGFTPLYGTGSANGQGVGTAASDLADITVSAPDSMTGRALKFDLLDQMNNGGNQPVSPLYILSIRPNNYSQNLAIQQNATVTRANFVLVVPFTLTSIATGKVIYHATARARSSYDRVESEFANLNAMNYAMEQTSKSVADDITLQLSVYFKTQKVAAKTTPE
jgi:LPS-assembly lipoprotein